MCSSDLDQCFERVDAGKDPACVHHCQAFAMKYGRIDDLSKEVDEGSKFILYYL